MDPNALDDETLNSLTGTLGSLGEVLSEMSNPSTTAEAHRYAREFLDDYREGMPGEKEIEAQFETNAEQTREILRRARERIAARKFDKRQLWLAAAKGLGSPTRTGAIGESASLLAGELMPVREKEQDFNLARENDLIGIDQALGTVDDKQLARRLQLLIAKQGTQGELAKEALKTLGRQVKNSTGARGADAVDRAYAPDYIEFITNGASVAAKSLEELGLASKALRSGDDKLTGPIVGGLASIPVIGKAGQDIFNPKASDVQELVESTIQASLRPILGAQFTEKEGERLISRVYNKRMDERINADRVDRLRQQIQRAYEQKLAAAEYWRKHNTLRGFEGQTSWTIDDFMPDRTWPGGANFRPEADDEDEGEIMEVYVYDPDEPDPDEPDPEAAPPINTTGEVVKDVIRIEDLPNRKKPYKRRLPWDLFRGKGFADGGEVEGERELFIMPDGAKVTAPVGMSEEEVVAQYMAAQEGSEADPTVTDRLAEGTIGGALGYLAAKYGARGAMGATNLLPGRSINQGEKRVLGLMDTMDIHPEFLAQRLRELQKRQVPAMMLDVAGPEMRGLGEAALLPKATETGPFLDELKIRQRGTRERVADQVNTALAPDPFTSHYDDLTKRRSDTAKTNYAAAYQAHPKVPAAVVAPFLQAPSFEKAWKQAEKGWKDRPGSKGKLPYKVDATGTVYDYPLEFLDDVKKRFDDLISVAKQNGQNQRVKDLTTIQQQFRDALDKATMDKTGKSKYQSAREAYEEDSKLIDQMDFGRNEFLKLSPEDAAKHVAGLDFTQKDALRTGVAEALFRNLKGPYTDTNPAQKLAGSPDAMARLETLFDNPKDFEIFKEALEAEREMFDETRGTLGKGKSARGSYEPPDSAITRLARKAPALGVFSPTYWALKRARAESKITEKEADQIIRILKTRDPKVIEENLGSKFRRKAKRRKAAGKAGLVGAAIGAAAPFIADGIEDEEEPIRKAKGGGVRRLYEKATGRPVRPGDKVRYKSHLADEPEEEVEITYVRDPGPHSSGKVTARFKDGSEREYYSDAYGLELREPEKPKLSVVKKKRGGRVGLARLKEKYGA